MIEILVRAGARKIFAFQSFTASSGMNTATEFDPETAENNEEIEK